MRGVMACVLLMAGLTGAVHAGPAVQDGESVMVGQSGPGLFAYRVDVAGATDLVVDVTWSGRSEGERVDSGAEWFMGFVVVDGVVVWERLYGIGEDTSTFAWAAVGPVSVKDDARSVVFEGSLGGWSAGRAEDTGAMEEVLFLVASSAPHLSVMLDATWTEGVVDTEWVLLGEEALLTVPLSEFRGGVGAGAYGAGSVAVAREATWTAEDGFIGYVLARPYEWRPGLEGEWSWSCTVASGGPCTIERSWDYYDRLDGMGQEAWSFRVHTARGSTHDPLVVLGMRLPWSASAS